MSDLQTRPISIVQISARSLSPLILPSLATCSTAAAASAFSANLIPFAFAFSTPSWDRIRVWTNLNIIPYDQRTASARESLHRKETCQGAMMLTRMPIIGMVRLRLRIRPRTPHFDAQYWGEPGWSRYPAMLAVMIRTRSLPSPLRAR